MKRIKLIIRLFLLLIISGCGTSSLLNPKEPIIITLWHNYGGQMEKSMNDLVDEFNSTMGKEQGIIVNTTSISSSSALYDKIIASADGIPCSSELPNITTGYPKSALILFKKEKLVDLNEYFSEEELDQYLPRFIEEGVISGKLAVFPTAKSTEVLFLNKTLFDRFSDATGISIDSLTTFEGISETAIKYYEWTDSQTPEIPNDGKSFYTSDSWFNIAQVGMEQFEDSFIVNKTINYSDNYKKIWNAFFEAAVKGGFAIYDGYSSDLGRTGEIVCSTGSTAGILFYANTITNKDNTKQDVEYEILPFPVFKDGKKVAIQRGGGMIVTKSTIEKEYASAQFIKCFTAPEQNMKFISETGYLPVTKKAFENKIEESINRVENVNIKKLLKTAVKMYNEYDFYIPPVFDEIDSMEKTYNERLKQAALESRTNYLSIFDAKNADETFNNVSQNIFEAFIKEK